MPTYSLSDLQKQKSFDTNRIFIITEQKIDAGKKQKQGKVQKTAYIPGYLRLKVKNFTEMDLQNLNAKMNATMIFTIYYGDLELIDQNIPQILANNIVLLFGRDDAIKLSQGSENLQTSVKCDTEKNQITFTVRKVFNLRIESDVFWTPFQIINLILTITIQSVKIKLIKKDGQQKSKQQQQLTIKINLMNNYQNDYMKLSYTEQGTFGNYDLVQSRLKSIYSYDRVCNTVDFYLQGKQQDQKLQKKIEDKIKSASLQSKKKAPKAQFFQYAHFIVPLYKFPSVALATIFLPLWLLAFINLGIFFQNQALADRIGSIAALMIAFVGLIPVIRQQIPPNPSIVFIEILVYLETFTSFLALVHSLTVREIIQYKILWYQSGLFMVSACITVIIIIIIAIMMIIHYFHWEPSYNKQLDSKTKNAKFDRLKWKNFACNFYFYKYLLHCLKQFKNVKVQIRNSAGKNLNLNQSKSKQEIKSSIKTK